MSITISRQLQIMDKWFEDAYDTNPRQFTRGALIALGNRADTIASGLRGLPHPDNKRPRCICGLHIRSSWQAHEAGRHHRNRIKPH